MYTCICVYNIISTYREIASKVENICKLRVSCYRGTVSRNGDDCDYCRIAFNVAVSAHIKSGQ